MEIQTFIETALKVLDTPNQRNLQILVTYFIGKRGCEVGYGRHILPTLWHHLKSGDPVLSVEFEVYHGDDAPDPGLSELPYPQPPNTVIEDEKRKTVRVIFDF